MLKQVNAKTRSLVLANELHKMENDLRSNLLQKETTKAYRAEVLKQMRVISQARAALDKLAV